jgi:hypothetical protein
MALSKIQAESMNLADTYAFTGTVTGTPSDMILISSTNVTSAVSSVDFETLSTDYNNFMVQVGDFEPSSNGAGLRVRFKTTGTSGAYASGASDYSVSRQRIYQSGASTWTDSANGFISSGANVSLGINSSGNGYVEAGSHCTVWFHNIHSTDKRKSYNCMSWGGQDSQNSSAQHISGIFVGGGSLNAVTGIRFYFDSGNIAKGRFALYGFKQ